MGEHDAELAAALEALRAAWKIAEANYGADYTASVKGPGSDLVTDVDRDCEKAITDILRAHFPTYGLVLEEGPNVESRDSFTWIVDPLDGTNNYVYGHPLWGASIALCRNEMILVSCVVDAAHRVIWSCQTDEPLRRDSQVWDGSSERTPRIGLPSAALWKGYGTSKSSARLDNIQTFLSGSMKRVFENWCPTYDLGLYLRGGIDLIVGLECSGTELPAVLHCLRASGAAVEDLAGNSFRFGQSPPLFLAGAKDLVEKTRVRLLAAAGDTAARNEL